MPEASQEVEINIDLSLQEIRDMLSLPECYKHKIGCGWVTRKGNTITISTEQTVTVEFDMSDYAPDYDEWRD